MRCRIGDHCSGRFSRESTVGLGTAVEVAVAVGSAGSGSKGVDEKSASVGVGGVMVAARGRFGLKRVCAVLKALADVCVTT